MLGFLAMWPTLLTLAMFPVLLVVYLRQAKKKEELVTKEFGREYLEYCKSVPRFFPKWRRQ